MSKVYLNKSVLEASKERKNINKTKHYNSWVVLSKEIKSNPKQSLVKLIKKHNLNEHSRHVFINIGLIKNFGSGKLSNWKILIDTNSQDEFDKLYDDFIQKQNGNIYVFNYENVLIYESDNKQDISRKFNIGYKLLLAYSINGKCFDNKYFSYKKNFDVKKDAHKKILPKKLKQKEKVKKMKYENSVNSYGETHQLIENAKQSVIENNILEKQGKRKVVRLDKSLTIKERLNALKGKRSDSFL